MARRRRSRARRGPWRWAVSLATAATFAGCHEEGGRTASGGHGVAGGDPARGRRLVATYGCGSCHVIPGVPGAAGRVGPPLDAFADRGFIAGAVRNEPSALVRWIQVPQEIQPGTVMPDLGVTEAHARDIAAYLYTLTDGGLGPPHPIPSSVLPVH